MNDQPFNVAVCRAGPCRTDPGLDLIDRLRASIRRCPHGVLLSTGCLLGASRCRQSAAHDAGPCLIVQPCDRERRPRGAAIAVGPVLSSRDADAVAAWLEDGGLDARRLAPRLWFRPGSPSCQPR